MNRHFARLAQLAALPALFLALLGAPGVSLSASATEPGRLFYTPAQRAQLEAARARNVTQLGRENPATGPAPVRFDGEVIRSDGSRIRWVNGQEQGGASGLTNLKPGQVRADGKVYEPYQIRRPSAGPSTTGEPQP